MITKMKISSTVLSLLALFASTWSMPGKKLTPDDLNNLYKEGKYETFAKALGIDDPDLVQPSPHVSSPDDLNADLNQGDLILTPEQEAELKKNPKYSIGQGKIWKSGVVPYAVIESSYSGNDAQKVKDIMTQWDSEAPVQFRSWEPTDDDYVVVFNGNKCFSNLGETGTLQSISLQSPQCVTNGKAFHQMMHTVAFIHENNRPDRDSYIRVLWDNIPDDWKPTYYKANPEGFEYDGPYDLCSITHFSVNVPGTNVPAFEVIQPNANQSCIGQRQDLTAIDKMKLKKRYSK